MIDISLEPRPRFTRKPDVPVRSVTGVAQRCRAFFIVLHPGPALRAFPSASRALGAYSRSLCHPGCTPPGSQSRCTYCIASGETPVRRVLVVALLWNNDNRGGYNRGMIKGKARPRGKGGRRAGKGKLLTAWEPIGRSLRGR